MFWLVKPDQTFHHFIYYRNDWTNLLRVIENTASAIFFFVRILHGSVQGKG